MNCLNLKTKILLPLSMIVGLFILPSLAQATSIVATGGNVVVTFGGSDAGYTSKLFLGSTEIMSSKSAAGTTFDLGSFTAGQVLDFRLEVQNTGAVFFTGSGAANIDGVTHAMVGDLGDSTQVGWEDLLGGGDQDYNDLVFNLSNTMAGEEGYGNDVKQGKLIANPEPSTIILFGSGLLGLGAWRLRKKQA